jgi:hypothetical protein
VTYLDRLQLIVVDHPAKVRVYPEERFATRAPSQDLIAFEQEIHPVQARDHKGRDVTALLAKRDRDMVDGFARRSWLGYAEEHFVELDFGDRLANLRSDERVFLCLTGWTDYPYPEAMWAAEQAGIALVPPVLERENGAGKWEVIVPEVGFPAGRPRLMMADVTGKVHGPHCRLRLRTNMQVFWDQIFLAPVKSSLPGTQVAETGKHQAADFQTTTLAVLHAELSPGYCMQEYSPDGKAPTLFDFHKSNAVPVSRLAGKLTRFGTVTELLHSRDDRFVIFGAGDELSVSFAAEGVPPLAPGWSRSFVLRTWGYCKTSSSFTATGQTIEPLPFAAMTSFPYGPGESYPRTPLHREYLRTYQTRGVK